MVLVCQECVVTGVLCGWVAQPGTQNQPEISMIAHNVAAVLFNALHWENACILLCLIFIHLLIKVCGAPVSQKER